MATTAKICLISLSDQTLLGFAAKVLDGSPDSTIDCLILVPGNPIFAVNQ